MAISREVSFLNSCLGLQKSESFLIISNPSRKEEGSRIQEAAQSMGVEARMMLLNEDVLNEKDLPSEIKGAILGAKVCLFSVSYDQTQALGHIQAKKEAINKGGRIGFLTKSLDDFHKDKIERISGISRHLADRLSQAKVARIETGDKRVLTMKLDDRPALALDNLLVNPGDWGALPDFSEAAVAPLEGKIDGEYYADGMAVGIGLLDPPMHLRIKDGRVTEISGGQVARRFESQLELVGDDCAFMIAELGLGANPYDSTLSGTFEDKKLMGTIHIGLGDNRNLHGCQACPMHTDVLTRKPSLFLDGEEVIRSGRMILPI